jgi:hypothetical protein
MSQDKNYSRKQRALDIVNGENATMSKAQKRAAETASLNHTEGSPADISTADGAKVLNNLDELAKDYDNLTTNNRKSFLNDVAEALGAKKHGSNSQYATFETKNGQTVTIRLANHNAKVSTFDNHGEDNGISIVVLHRANQGVTNDGQAHVVEYYYPETGLRKADGKPLADIVRAIKQSLYRSEEITPDQAALLEKPNSSQYQPEQGLSASKVTNNSINVQENEQENAEKEKKITEESLKQFIGDWEKGPENATKVFDEKGQPIVVYRGGGRLGNIEDACNNAKYGIAYYATPSRYGAEEFAEERTGDKNNVLGGVH